MFVPPLDVLKVLSRSVGRRGGGAAQISHAVHGNFDSRLVPVASLFQARYCSERLPKVRAEASRCQREGLPRGFRALHNFMALPGEGHGPGRSTSGEEAPLQDPHQVHKLGVHGLVVHREPQEILALLPEVLHGLYPVRRVLTLIQDGVGQHRKVPGKFPGRGKENGNVGDRARVRQQKVDEAVTADRKHRKGPGFVEVLPPEAVWKPLLPAENVRGVFPIDEPRREAVPVKELLLPARAPDRREVARGREDRQEVRVDPRAGQGHACTIFRRKARLACADQGLGDEEEPSLL